MGFVTDAMHDISGALTTDINYRAQAPGYELPGTSPQEVYAQNLFRDMQPQQQDFSDMLLAQAQGQGPSVAETLMQQGIDRSTASAAGQIASAKGIDPGLRAQLISKTAADQKQRAVADAAMLRAQEMLSGRQLYGQNLAQRSGQALQAGNLALSGRDVTQRGRAQKAGLGLQAQGINAQTAQQQAQMQNQMLMGLMQGGASAAMMASDEDLKENVGDFDSKEFFKAIEGKTYDYKNPELGEDRQIGIMAQDLEKKAPQMVEDTPQGKAIDYNKAGGILFASLSDISKRLSELEGSKAGKVLKYSDGGKAGYEKGGYVNMVDGGYVPGKAEVKGDSPKNDFIEALLSPGEIVIPRTAAKSPEAAKDFIDEIMNKGA